MTKTLKQIRKLLKEEAQETLIVDYDRAVDYLLKPLFELLKKNLTGMKVQRFSNDQHVQYHFTGNKFDVEQLKRAFEEIKDVDAYLKSESLV